jgi:hypothetical protein
VRMLSIIGPLRFVGTLAEGGGDPRHVVETTCDDVGDEANSRANNWVPSCPRSSRRVSCPSECTTHDLQICDILGFPGNGQDDSGSPYGSEGCRFESCRARQILGMFSLVRR